MKTISIFKSFPYLVCYHFLNSTQIIPKVIIFWTLYLRKFRMPVSSFAILQFWQFLNSWQIGTSEIAHGWQVVMVVALILLTLCQKPAMNLMALVNVRKVSAAGNAMNAFLTLKRAIKFITCFRWEPTLIGHRAIWFRWFKVNNFRLIYSNVY